MRLYLLQNEGQAIWARVANPRQPLCLWDTRASGDVNDFGDNEIQHELGHFFDWLDLSVDRNAGDRNHMYVSSVTVNDPDKICIMCGKGGGMKRNRVVMQSDINKLAGGLGLENDRSNKTPRLNGGKAYPIGRFMENKHLKDGEDFKKAKDTEHESGKW